MNKIAATIAVMTLVAPQAISAADQESEYISWMFASVDEVLVQVLTEDVQPVVPEPSLEIRQDAEPVDIEYGELGW